MHVVGWKILALKSTLLLRKMLFFKPKVLQNGRKFEALVNIKMASMTQSSIEWSQKALQFIEK